MILTYIWKIFLKQLYSILNEIYDTKLILSIIYDKYKEKCRIFSVDDSVSFF